VPARNTTKNRSQYGREDCDPKIFVIHLFT
jgi:hypothetical protein